MKLEARVHGLVRFLEPADVHRTVILHDEATVPGMTGGIIIDGIFFWEDCFGLKMVV